jgi:hypothetical protein
MCISKFNTQVIMPQSYTKAITAETLGDMTWRIDLWVAEMDSLLTNLQAG